MRTLNTKAAKRAGYRALTVPYKLPREEDMLHGVIADMRRGRIDHVLVKEDTGVAVWRKGRTAR